jgi:hypothetical protein
MGLSRIEELARQSDSEGVTLASLILKNMTADEIAEAEKDLADAVAASSARIHEFMSDVEIQSVWDLLENDEMDEPAGSAGPVFSDD